MAKKSQSVVLNQTHVVKKCGEHGIAGIPLLKQPSAGPLPDTFIVKVFRNVSKLQADIYSPALHGSPDLPENHHHAEKYP